MSLIALAMIMVHWNYECKYNLAWGVDDASLVYVCMSLRNKYVHIYKYVLYNENYRKLNLLHFPGVILICMKVLQFYHYAFVICTMQYSKVILNTFDIPRYIYV